MAGIIYKPTVPFLPQSSVRPALLKKIIFRPIAALFLLFLALHVLAA